jgi:hypothetical protein
MYGSKTIILAISGLLCFAACSGFDEDAAAVQIREAFCGGWPYGCTENTVVEVVADRGTPHGRQVEFKVVDGADETAILKAAYFEREDDKWTFRFFEPPFSTLFAEETNRVAEDEHEFTEQLMDLKAAQKWFKAIYGRFAGSLAELDSVSYKRGETPVQMTVADDGSSWLAVVGSQYVQCILDVPSQQLPNCEALPAASMAGTSSGPLSTAFGEAQ